MKRRVEICEGDHRCIYEDIDVDEWRRRIVDYVFECVQNNTGIRQDVIYMIGRLQYWMLGHEPAINVEQGIPLLQRVISDEHTTLIIGFPDLLETAEPRLSRSAGFTHMSKAAFH